MSTLLLCFAAPLQSWGVDSKFNRRTTAREPTKSGVVGLIAAALGRARDADIADLVALRFGVRVDQPGQLLVDYHTARGKGNTERFITYRHYLADAVFLVGLEGDAELLGAIDAAVRAPVFPLYLGRRSCPPAGRVSLGLRPVSLDDALWAEPWQARTWYQKGAGPDVSLTVVWDADADTPYVIRRRDMPVTFSQKRRTHDFRALSDTPNAVPMVSGGDGYATDHDAMAELEG
jgi:CRISPR system Cascade subunit CasD